MDLSKLEPLHTAIAALKALPRTGWVQRGVPAPESVAAHSYGVALLTLVLAEARAQGEEPVDVLTALRMALVHDLPEHAVGDLTPTEQEARFGTDPRRAEVAREAAERSALDEALTNLPSFLSDSLAQVFAAYRRQDTPEAKLVHQADRLDCLLQALRYRDDGAGSALDEFARLIEQITDPALAQALRARWQIDTAD